MDNRNKYYQAGFMMLQAFSYCCFSVLLFSVIKVAAYSPSLLRANFNKLGSVRNPNTVIHPTSELSGTISFFGNLGLAYPPLFWSFIGTLLAGILLYSFFPVEYESKKVLKSFLAFILGLFGMLITLFSIWGA